MVNKIEYLFVYGTLRNAFNSSVKAQIKSDVEWVSIGEIKGKLYDIGNYPGAVPVANEEPTFIKGEILKILNPEIVFKILDKYEGFDPDELSGSEYYREQATVFLSGGKTIEAWVYWYNFSVDGKLRILDQDYLNYLKMKLV